MKTQKTWLITGGARGLGLELTKAALASGDKVVATVRRKPNELAGTLGNNANLHVAILDVTSEEQAKVAVAQAVHQFGSIDVLVNNAGYGLLAGVEEATDAEARKVFDTNVFGALNLIRAVLPQMRKQHSGHVINISSVGGLSGSYGWGVYGSTKFAIEGITEAMALELAPLGIFATAVEPGFFRTNFLDNSSLVRTLNPIEDYAETVGKMRDFASQVNNKQPGDPARLAQAVLKLAASKKPPVHLPLGEDTMLRYRKKVEAFESEIQAWHDVIISTAHENEG